MSKVDLASRRRLLATLAGAAACGRLVGRDSASGEEISVSPGSPDAPLRITAAERAHAATALLKYFVEVAPRLLRPAEGKLQHPSLAISLPGKEYSTSIWDWDSLWVMHGLFQVAKRQTAGDLHRQVRVHAQGTLLNFLDHQSEEGRLPIMMFTSNTDPFGCLTKAVPNYKNQAKPVFGQMALLIADEVGSVEWLRPRFDALLRFFDSWTLGNQTALGLLVWGDDVAIGNDNDPTTFGRPFFSSANLLLNTFFYQDLRSAATLATRLGRAQDAQRLALQADALAAQILHFCWDPRDRFFYTVDVQCTDRRAQLIPGGTTGMAMSWQCLPLRIEVFTGFLPLWCGIATREQAAAVVREHYLADDRFRAAWGVRSLSNRESMYALDASGNPSNWIGPVWIMANYFVWKGLRDYGFTEAATELADKTILLLANDLEKHGSLNEYYHPDTGAAISHDGFLDWNLLVAEMMGPA